MATARASKTTVWLLAVALIFSIGGLAYLFFQNFIWKAEALRYAESSGRSAAQALFRKGSLSLYKIEGESDSDHFSGRREGRFEVWIKFYQPSLGSAHRQTTERWIESFNDQMRRMEKNPEKFRKTLDEVGR